MSLFIFFSARFLVYIGIVMIFVFTMTSMFVFVGCAAPNPQVVTLEFSDTIDSLVS